MASSQLIKEQLLTDIEKLPEDSLGEVLNFVSFLLWQKSKRQAQVETQATTPEQDPMQAFIGGVTHGALAERIDEGLYGD